MRDQLLMLLAVNRRPIYVAELERMLGSDNRKIRNTLKTLLACGLVLRDTHSSGARYVWLNREFPGYPQLLTLLRKLEQRYPQERVGKPKRRAERLALRDLSRCGNAGPFYGRQLDRLFYSEVRTRVLLGIAATADTDVRDLCRTLGLDARSTWNAANHWQREGIVKSIVRGRRRALELDSDFFAARELRLFLHAVIRHVGDYAVRARYSTRNPSSPMFVARR